MGMYSRLIRYNQNVVDSLRSIRMSMEKKANEKLIADLKPYTDDQVYNAYENWSSSEDYPDEILIPLWIEEE